MTREEITAFVARRQEALAGLDIDGVTALHAEDGVFETPMAGTVIGRESIAQFYRGLFAAFPDLKLQSEELLIDGDRVAQTATMVGTDVGGFMGLPPSGKQFRIPLVFLFTLKDHHIVRLRAIYDFTSMLVQIGVLKVKPT
jgi:steroid delta-isomerase-like uncharacterized protein